MKDKYSWKWFKKVCLSHAHFLPFSNTYSSNLLRLKVSINTWVLLQKLFLTKILVWQSVNDSVKKMTNVVEMTCLIMMIAACRTRYHIYTHPLLTQITLILAFFWWLNWSNNAFDTWQHWYFLCQHLVAQVVNFKVWTNFS